MEDREHMGEKGSISREQASETAPAAVSPAFYSYGRRLGPDVLTEIMGIVVKGLREQSDVSEMLREIELVPDGEKLKLSDEYMRRTGRWTGEG